MWPIPLRDYQGAAFDGVQASMHSRHRYPLLQGATGSGKTRIAAAIACAVFNNGKRVLFLAPRRELVYQCRGTFAGFGLRTGVIMAGETSDPGAPVQVASFDTLRVRGLRHRSMDLPPAELVIVDECHLAVSKARIAILDHYRTAGAYILGLTATPARSDGRGLGEVFDDLVLGPSIASLVADGHLVPLEYYAPSDPDLAGVRVVRGDYQQSSLSDRMNTPGEIRETVRSWEAIAGGRSTVVFCVDREHGRAMCAAFKRAKVKAEYLDGKTPLEERKGIMARVASGKTTVLVNILVATFGTDLPRLECVILARPTRDVTLYLQTVGRVLRPSPETGKTHAIVIDHAGAVLRHGFVDRPQPWTLDGGIKIAEESEKLARKRHDPKEKRCPACSFVVSGVRECPHCGHVLVEPGDPVPVYRVDTDGPDPSTREGQIAFYATTKAMQEAKEYAPGWLAHSYFAMYGVWPDADLKANVKAAWASNEALDILKRRLHEYKERKRIEVLRAKGLYGGQAWTET